MSPFDQRMVQLILGKRGGPTRINIIELLRTQPYNTNQLAHLLGLNYRTVKFHIKKLIKNGLVEGSGVDGYGQVYHLTPDMERSYKVFLDVIKKYSDIKASPHFFEQVIKQTHDSVFFLDSEGKVLFMNESAETLFGYSEDELLGKELCIFTEPDLPGRYIKGVKEEGEIKPFDTKGKRRSGETIEINVHIDVIEDVDKNVIGMYVLSRDIKERKAVEMALRDAQEYLEDILETIPIPIVLLDENTNVIYANPSFCDLFGIEPEDSLRKNLHEIGNKHLDIPELKNLMRELLADEIPIDNFQVDLDLPNGGPKRMLLNVRPLIKKSERTTQMLLLCSEMGRR